MRNGEDGGADGLGDGRPPSGLVGRGCEEGANCSCLRLSEFDGIAGGCGARGVGGDGGSFGDDDWSGVGAMNGFVDPVRSDM